jgi:uncharacterized membrane protein YdfJ with MMPL/SSD domain
MLTPREGMTATIAAFSGFVDAQIVGLQEFGLGLVAAILIDAPTGRALLAPSLMAVLGRWNWWLPHYCSPCARRAVTAYA